MTQAVNVTFPDEMGDIRYTDYTYLVSDSPKNVRDRV